MVKRGIQESNFAFGTDRIDEFAAQKTSMPIIRCVCGFEILVVPDLKAMNRAIKNHVVEHKKSASEKLTDFLTVQTLIVASNPA
jgi:hypothetical protein